MGVKLRCDDKLITKFVKDVNTVFKPLIDRQGMKDYMELYEVRPEELFDIGENSGIHKENGYGYLNKILSRITSCDTVTLHNDELEELETWANKRYAPAKEALLELLNGIKKQHPTGMRRVVLDRTSDPVVDATEIIYGYFEDMMADQGYENLNNAREHGEQLLPQDEYLYKLSDKLERAKPTFSYEEIEEVAKVAADMRGSGYDRDMLRAMSQLLAELKEAEKGERAKNQAKNILAANAAGLFRAGKNELTAFNKLPAINRARGQPFFVTEVAKYLTGQPRATRESEGGIGPVIRNLKKVSRGRAPSPLRRYGTGTRKNRSRSRSGSRSGSRSR